MAKIALITGASGGLGQAVAKKLLHNDWQLILVGLDAEKLNTTFGQNHTQIVADCSTSAGVQKLVAALKIANLVPTALAHCVGNIRLGTLHRMPETDFMDCIQANLFSAFYTLAGFTNRLNKLINCVLHAFTRLLG